MRAQVSLLLANGHTNARRYPIATVWYEAELVTERENMRHVTDAVLLRAAIVSVISPKQSACDHFDNLLKDLRNGN